MSRGKAWRRSKEATNRERRARTAAIREKTSRRALQGFHFPGEKRWKDNTGRSNKVRRGRQLGFDYPRKTQRQILDEHVGSGAGDLLEQANGAREEN